MCGSATPATSLVSKASRKKGSPSRVWIGNRNVEPQPPTPLFDLRRHDALEEAAVHVRIAETPAPWFCAISSSAAPATCTSSDANCAARRRASNLRAHKVSQASASSSSRRQTSSTCAKSAASAVTASWCCLAKCQYRLHSSALSRASATTSSIPPCSRAAAVAAAMAASSERPNAASWSSAKNCCSSPLSVCKRNRSSPTSTSLPALSPALSPEGTTPPSVSSTGGGSSKAWFVGTWTPSSAASARAANSSRRSRSARCARCSRERTTFTQT
mmetsp:Transcript_112798/g.318933  ORF Transcript_112798/g.318933 Transcript_112798/m.318933 type:complete len:273 (-) Transcript_112798:1734-2552(-)